MNYGVNQIKYERIFTNIKGDIKGDNQNTTFYILMERPVDTTEFPS